MEVNRCCIACRKRNFKKDLIRIVSYENKVIVDDLQKLNTRGMYICKDKKCVDKVLKIISKNKFKCSLDLNVKDLEELLVNISDTYLLV